MDPKRRFSPRVFAVLALLVAVAAFLALEMPLAWIVENGHLRLKRAQGAQSLPLYAIPYCVIQLITGLTFDELHERWLALGRITKVAGVVAACASVAVVVYVGQYIGLNELWVGNSKVGR